MKILEVKIYSPDSELLRKVEFKDIGLSIIYGDVEKPNNDNETSNSIGKTVLLKILNTITDKNSVKKTDLEKIEIKISQVKTSMKLNSYKSFKIINQSITGLFENEIDILG